MEIQKHQYSPFIFAWCHNLPKSLNLRKVLFFARLEFPIEILSNNTGSIIPNKNSIRIKHGYNHKANIVVLYPILNIYICHRFLNKTIQNPRGSSFSWMCPCIYDYVVCNLFWWIFWTDLQQWYRQSTCGSTQLFSFQSDFMRFQRLKVTKTFIQITHCVRNSWSEVNFILLMSESVFKS